MHFFLKEYIDKLALLKKATKSVTYRLKERKNRPKKLDELNEVLNKSLKFLDSIKNVTGGEDQPVSPAQFSSLEKIINSTEVTTSIITVLLISFILYVYTLYHLIRIDTLVNNK